MPEISLKASIRRANTADADAIARVKLDTWRTAYRDLLPRAYLDGMSLEKITASQKKHLVYPDQARFVAESSQKMTAYVAVGKNRVPLKGFDCELYGIYVRPAFYRLGFGKSLFKAGVLWLKAQKYQSMIVWVLKENPARAFYEKCGGKLLSASRVRVFNGQRMTEVSYGWETFE